MFKINLKDQKLPGFTDLLDVDVIVTAVTLTNGNMQSQWSIELPQSGNKLPGSEPLPPLFKGNFDKAPPQAMVDQLKAYFAVVAPGLVASLITKADAIKTT
jgi:hypothetical protein